MPCSAPGASFACACRSGERGTQICLQGGDYSACACAFAPSDDHDAGAGVGTSGSASEPVEPAAVSCPAPYACVEQMGYEVCAEASGLPPFCESAADCASAGLPAADCLDPGVGGVKVCVQVCER